jgi:hypothetical protein
MEHVLDRTKLYEDQANYCNVRLARISDPRRKALVERERDDWLVLADQERTWSEIVRQRARAA